MSKSTVALIQARMSSSRFPGKVLSDLGGKPMILSMLDRVGHAQSLSNYIVVTSNSPSDDPLASVLSDVGQPVFRGSLGDVLDRFKKASDVYPADNYVRLTGDCPLIDPAMIDRVVDLLNSSGADYASNIEPATFADGMDVEAFSRRVLVRAHHEASAEHDREHVTLWMRSETAALKRANIASFVDGSGLRLTVDYPDDLEDVRSVVSALGNDPQQSDYYAILRYLDSRRGLAQRTSHIRNEALETTSP